MMMTRNAKMNIKENMIWDAFQEVKAHPEILKDALQETENDLETLWVGIQTVLHIADVVNQYVTGKSGRSMKTTGGQHITPGVQAAAARIYEKMVLSDDE